MYTRLASIPKPKEPKAEKAEKADSDSSSGSSKGKKRKIPKNIKIDNINIDGNGGDVNWEDFIKINNGAGDSDETQDEQFQQD